MKKFFAYLLLYTSIMVSLYTAYIVLVVHILNTKGLYTIPADKSVLILGNSHTTHSINDSILEQGYNLSNPADAFGYSYAKLRKILPLNHNIKIVLVSCSEEDITERIERVRLQLITDVKLSKYFFLMTPAELLFMAMHNPAMTIKPLCGIPKAQTARCLLVLKKKITLGDLQLGGYESLNGRINVAKELKKRAEDTDDITQVARRQIGYLHKIVALCRENNVKLILIRPPEYKLYVRKNEKIFIGLLHNEFSDVTFKDCVNMHMPDSCFRDMDHLNHFGARLFTDSIKEYLKGITSK